MAWTHLSLKFKIVCKPCKSEQKHRDRYTQSSSKTKSKTPEVNATGNATLIDTQPLLQVKHGKKPKSIT